MRARPLVSRLPGVRRLTALALRSVVPPSLNPLPLAPRTAPCTLPNKPHTHSHPPSVAILPVPRTVHPDSFQALWPPAPPCATPTTGQQSLSPHGFAICAPPPPLFFHPLQPHARCPQAAMLNAQLSLSQLISHCTGQQGAEGAEKGQEGTGTRGGSQSGSAARAAADERRRARGLIPRSYGLLSTCGQSRCCVSTWSWPTCIVVC